MLWLKRRMRRRGKSGELEGRWGLELKEAGTGRGGCCSIRLAGGWRVRGRGLGGERGRGRGGGFRALLSVSPSIELIVW